MNAITTSVPDHVAVPASGSIRPCQHGIPPVPLFAPPSATASPAPQPAGEEGRGVAPTRSAPCRQAAEIVDDAHKHTVLPTTTSVTPSSMRPGPCHGRLPTPVGPRRDGEPVGDRLQPDRGSCLPRHARPTQVPVKGGEPDAHRNRDARRTRERQPRRGPRPDRQLRRRSPPGHSGGRSVTATPLRSGSTPPSPRPRRGRRSGP